MFYFNLVVLFQVDVLLKMESRRLVLCSDVLYQEENWTALLGCLSKLVQPCGLLIFFYVVEPLQLKRKLFRSDHLGSP
eukprot:SAG31_NODE_43558_length_266_cov_1.215569_1_plen_77_part_01